MYFGLIGGGIKDKILTIRNTIEGECVRWFKWVISFCWPGFFLYIYRLAEFISFCFCICLYIFTLLDVQPSPYCAYKFLDYPDHDTVILRNTNEPEINDHKIYSVPVTYELDQYLRTSVSFGVFCCSIDEHSWLVLSCSVNLYCFPNGIFAILQEGFFFFFLYCQNFKFWRHTAV